MTDWDKEIEEIEQRKWLSREQGGAENVAKHHEKGRLTIRERIDLLVDSGTFTEPVSYTHLTLPTILRV